MKKLKDILLEAYAWERRPGQSLPTLAEVQAEYLRNEAADAVKAKVAKLEKEIADLKHQYYSVSNLSPEREKQLRKQLGEKGRELKRAKREDKTGSAGYKNSKPERWQDSDGDGIWYEPGVDVKENVNEGASFQERFAEYSDDALRDMIVTLQRFDGTKDDIRELEQELDRRKHDKGNVNEYGDDETHGIDIDTTGVDTYDAAYDTPKDAMTEAFWNRVNGNLLGHDWILENHKKQLNETAVLNDIIIKKKSDSTIIVRNKKTKTNSLYKIEYSVNASNIKLFDSKFDLTFEEIYSKPNLSIVADLPIIKMINYTIEFDKTQTNKIKQAFEKNQNIAIKWNMIRIMFTKQR